MKADPVQVEDNPPLALAGLSSFFRCLPVSSPPASSETVDIADIAHIAAALDACGGLACRFDVDVLEECDSTNSRLMARAEAGAPSGTVIVARQQTAGRGRRGRSWHSAAGDTLMFSLLWRFPRGTPLSGLSLAAGLALADALRRQGYPDICLKWPNDVLLGRQKLAGILTELVSGTGAGTSGTAAIIGIGLNRHLPADLPTDLRAQAAALDQCAVPLPSSATLLAALLAALHERLQAFSRHGFAALRDDWCAHHAFAHQAVRLLGDHAPALEGICRGVDDEGALLLETTTGLQRVLSGELSLRPANPGTPS